MSTSNPPQLSLLLTLPLALVLATSVLATTTQATASQPPNPTRPSNGSTQHKEPAAILGRYLTTNNQRQAYVSGGSLISFGENLLAQEKADILDSLLFAELSAGDVYNRNTNFLSWYKLYMEVLRETGWQVAGFSLEPYNAPQNSYFKLANMVIDFLKPKCHSTQQEILQRLMNIWAMLKNFDERVVCFLKSSGHGGPETNVANFQIMPATRGDPGEIVVVFGGFHYQANKPVSRYLTYFWHSQDITVYRSVVVAKFRSANYTSFRQPLRNALASRARDLIWEIDF